MRLLVDECCETDLVEALRTYGHDVLYVIESLRGESDDKILESAFSENRILITNDKDFGELVYRLNKPAKGIILLRFDVSDHHFKGPRLCDLLKFESQRLYGAFVVLEVSKTRIRPLIG